MKSILLYLLIGFVSFSAVAQEQGKTITFSYWSEATPPFVISSNADVHDVHSGVLKDLAQKISQELKATPRLVDLPVQRIESQLQSGAIDLDCITNPIWKEKPDQYHWSPPIFKGADRFMVKKGKEQELTKFEDLKGKNLGVYNGYVYHETIMAMIKSGDINVVKVSGIDHGIKLLLLDRIDMLIDFDALLKYKIKSYHSNELALADLIAEKYDLYCAYSKKTTFDINQLNDALTGLVESGEIQAILSQY